MPTSEDEGETGGEFRKRLQQRVLSAPYERRPLAARGIYGPPPETEAGGSRWFSNLADPASRVIVGSASRLLSVFGKGPADPPGEHINTVEEALEVKSSLEIREQGENLIDVQLSIHNNGSDGSEQELSSRNDAFFELEQLLKQKRFSSAEIDHLTELLHSRTIEPSTLPSIDKKNKGKIDDDSSINSSSSQQEVNHEKKEMTNTSELDGQMQQLVNIPEEDFEAPIEIAKAYMGLKPRITAPSTLGLQSKIYRRDKASSLNIQLGTKPSNAAIAYRSGIGCMTQKPPARSALSKMSRSPYCSSFMMTKPREYSFYKDSNVEPTRSLEWTPSPSNIRHSGHGQALKRSSSDRDAGCSSDARRVRQKTCLKDSNLSSLADASSSIFLGPNDLDCKIPSTSVFHVPPHSAEMARKIFHRLDKLIPSPQNKSSEKKVIVPNASFFKSSLSSSHEGFLKFKANNDSSTKLPNVGGSRILEDPSSSNLANHGMNSMDSKSHGFALISMRKEPIVQSVPDDKVESTKAEHAIISSVKEPREKSFENSFEYIPTSGLMHADSDERASNKAYTLADDATPKREESVSTLKFASKPITTGISARLNAGSLSAASSSTDIGAPKFQFGTANSSCYSFTGVSAVSSSTDVGVGTPVFSFFHPH